MIFRQWLDIEGERCSYLLADPVTRAAAVIDAQEGTVGPCIEEVERLRLEIQWAFETRLHIAHRSAAAWVRQETGARVVAHAATGIACADLHAEEGDGFYLGEETLTFLHLPGICPGAGAVLWGDRLFTGDTLWPGGAGPLGPGGDAASLRSAIEDRLFDFPDETLVFPGACPDGRRVTTIGEERASAAEVGRESHRRLAGSGLRPDITAFNRECSQHPVRGHASPLG
ncbi:MAG: MBL fold metallo-hydrolase [Thiohalospira sp.]|uniref:MBL fold metallo-hydrolase n=1 Tax=Thiohalospira sp. TaxID=3080549 RepID=UPI0039808046